MPANLPFRAAESDLAEEQAALRRVATLVARGAPPNEILWTVSDEVGRLFATEYAAVGRFGSDGALDLLGAGRTQERWVLTDSLASAEVFRTGRPARAALDRPASDDGATA